MTITLCPIFTMWERTTNYDWGFPIFICIIASDMEKNIKGVLFHFPFDFVLSVKPESPTAQ